MTMNNIGTTIKVLREIKGISPKEMAMELDMSISGYSKIERGETDISLSRLVQIAEVLETNVSKLLSPEATYSFNFANNAKYNGVIQNQYISESKDIVELISIMQKQLEVLTNIITKNQDS